MTDDLGPTEVWQARIPRALAAQLRDDARLLGLGSRTDVVRTALQLLHRHAAEQAMAASVLAFHDGAVPPRPFWLVPDEDDPAGDDARA